MQYMSKFLTLLWRLWGGIREPRVINAIQSSVYTILALVGLVVFFDSPISVERTIGTVLTNILGTFLFIGGLVGAPSALQGKWYWEKIALILMITASAIYMVAIFSPHTGTTTGNRLAQLGFTIVASLYFITRWIRIHGQDIDPTI
jgi:uncharacterized membrane protein HdeD (DUF308 family)